MNKRAAGSTEREMEYVEITQAEEMPVLSDAERAALIASIEEASAAALRGEGLLLKPDEIGPWLRAGLEQARMRRRDGT
jgi:hypothetical protein